MTRRQPCGPCPHGAILLLALLAGTGCAGVRYCLPPEPPGSEAPPPAGARRSAVVTTLWVGEHGQPLPAEGQRANLDLIRAAIEATGLVEVLGEGAPPDADRLELVVVCSVSDPANTPAPTGLDTAAMVLTLGAWPWSFRAVSTTELRATWHRPGAPDATSRSRRHLVTLRRQDPGPGEVELPAGEALRRHYAGLVRSALLDLDRQARDQGDR